MKLKYVLLLAAAIAIIYLLYRFCPSRKIGEDLVIDLYIKIFCEK